MTSISVVVPCYNQAHYLNECLQSVLLQTYQNWECIIVNDGSSDDTEEVAKKWTDKDARFSYIKQTNKGVSAARNCGIAHAKGEWILPLDSDNTLFPNYLKLAEQRFQDNFKIITCEIQRFGLETTIWLLPDFSLENLAKGNMIENCSFYRKSDWELIHGYDEALIYGYEDWDFWISMLKSGGEVLKLDYLGMNYRVSEISRTTTLWQDNRLDKTLKQIEKKHFDFFAKYLPSWHLSYEREKIHSVTLAKYNERFILKVMNKIYDILSF